MGRSFRWDRLHRGPERSRYDTIKFPLCSKAMSAKERPKLSSPVPSVNVISRLTSYKWFKIFRKGFITRQSHSPHFVAYYDKQARIGCFKNIFTVQKVFLLSILYIYIFYSWNLKSHFQSVFKSIFLWSKRPINNLKMFLLTHTGTSDES